MRLLVLASESISARQLREAVPDDPLLKDVEVMVVAPALHASPLKFWFSDADEAIARAEDVRRQTLEELDQAGVAAIADTGESDPIRALEDALTTFPADRIVLFTHPDSEQRYREDIDLTELQDRFGIPVDRVTVAPSAS